MLRLVLIPLLMAALTAWAVTQFQLFQSRRSLAARSRPLRHPPVLVQAERLARALDVEKIEIFEWQHDQVNGLADADGRIYLSSGFLRKYGAGEVSAEELASVIAHELGHVTKGHMKRRMREAMGSQTALMAISMISARFLPFIGPWIASRLAQALTMRLSRRDEFEADAWASALLIQAGIGTGPQKSLFRKLNRLTGTESSGAGALVPDWLRSHPSTEDRIAAIEANERLWLKDRL